MHQHLCVQKLTNVSQLDCVQSIHIYIYIYILAVKSIWPPSKIFVSLPKSVIYKHQNGFISLNTSLLESL